LGCRDYTALRAKSYLQRGAPQCHEGSLKVLKGDVLRCDASVWPLGLWAQKKCDAQQGPSLPFDFFSCPESVLCVAIHSTKTTQAVACGVEPARAQTRFASCAARLFMLSDTDCSNATEGSNALPTLGQTPGQGQRGYQAEGRAKNSTSSQDTATRTEAHDRHSTRIITHPRSVCGLSNLSRAFISLGQEPCRRHSRAS